MLKRILFSSPGQGSAVHRVAGNIAWLIADRGVRIFTEIILSAWIASRLGAAEYGLQVYAFGFAAVLQPLASFGLETHITQLFVKKYAPQVVLGTAFWFKFAAGALAFFIALAAAFMVHPASDLWTRGLIVIASSTLVFRSLDVTDLWFQSRIEAHWSVLSRSLVAIVLAIVKIVMLESGASNLQFTSVLALEVLFVGLISTLVLRVRHPELREWRFDAALARDMLVRRWPTMAAAFCVAIYLRAGPVMLGWFHSSAEVGVFGAANRLAEVVYFLPTAIVASVTPLVMRFHERSAEEFERALLGVGTLLTWLGVIIALATILVAGPLVSRLYSQEFASAAPVLIVLVAAYPIVFGTSANGIWTTMLNHERAAFVRLFASAVLCVAMNLWLIPRFGALGAAYGLVGAQFAAGVIFHLPSQITRPQGLRFLRTFLPSGWRALVWLVRRS
jgi:O-antigen/teichoic acid export membrane protein